MMWPNNPLNFRGISTLCVYLLMLCMWEYGFPSHWYIKAENIFVTQSYNWKLKVSTYSSDMSVYVNIFVLVVTSSPPWLVFYMFSTTVLRHVRYVRICFPPVNQNEILTHLLLVYRITLVWWCAAYLFM